MSERQSIPKQNLRNKESRILEIRMRITAAGRLALKPLR